MVCGKLHNKDTVVVFVLVDLCICCHFFYIVSALVLFHLHYQPSFLLHVFHLLIPSPPVCLHAPFTSVHVCEWVRLLFSGDCMPSQALARPLMGLKYSLLALTSILRAGCHLSVNKPFSPGPASDSFWGRNPPQNRSEAHILNNYWEFNSYCLSLKLEMFGIKVHLWNLCSPFTAVGQSVWNYRCWECCLSYCWPQNLKWICFH